MHPLIQLRQTTSVFLVAFGLTCFGPSPAVQAVTPAPDGGYPNFNTAEGTNALFSLTSGTNNTANGYRALRNNTRGSYNTATGAQALLSNTTGIRNTANGAFALFSNTAGGGLLAGNTAIGDEALFSNTIGSGNTAIGDAALSSNVGGPNSEGDANTATGAQALLSNTTGSFNTASGVSALKNNTIGSSNTAVGHDALHGNTTGTTNIALGVEAGSQQTTGSSNIYIGDTGFGLESNVIAIGAIPSGGASYNRFYVGAVYGVSIPSPTLPVIVSSEGQLGTAPSAARFKKEIKPMDKTSESVLALKPVTFHYKSDKSNAPQFGLVAEEVAAVNPDLVVRDNSGEIYSVRYDSVNAMLLNEFLKEHKAFLEEHRTVEELKKQVALLTAGLQKVSAQLEVSKAAPQTVLNSQ
jgi:hypothetical protein